MRIGTWNTRILYRAGALRKLIAIVDDYNIDVTALQEIKWTRQGIIEKRRHTVYYSCHKKKHMFGVGFIVNQRLKGMINGGGQPQNL